MICSAWPLAAAAARGPKSLSRALYQLLLVHISTSACSYINFCLFMHLCRLCRLREWYHALLRQAKQEGIVTYISNLYDTFFEGGKDHRVDRPSATHLPYFEGAPQGNLGVASRARRRGSAASIRLASHPQARQMQRSPLLQYGAHGSKSVSCLCQDNNVNCLSAAHLVCSKGQHQLAVRPFHPFSRTCLDVCRDASVPWGRCHSVLTFPGSLQVITGLGRLRQCWPIMRSSSDRLAATGRAAQPLERHVASRTPR